MTLSSAFRFLGSICAVTCLSCVSGCAGYRLGTTLPADMRTIYVPTFKNRSAEPSLEAEATRATRQEFQKDGTLRLVDSEENADIVLDVAILRYNQEPLRYRRDRPRSTQEYRLSITAEITAVQRRTGGILVKQQVVGETSFELQGDLVTSKSSALPLAAADLAHKIVSSVVEAW